MRAEKPIWIFLGLLAAASVACGIATGQTSDDENLVFEDDNLTFGGDEQPAEAENITFADPVETPPAETVSPDPIDIPVTDFAQVATEIEPNDELGSATALGAVSDTAAGNPQFAARGTLSGRDSDYFSFHVEGDAQLYLIEALGPGVNRLSLYESAGRLAYARERADDAGWSITGIYLAPGDYHVLVEHHRDDGETAYSIRAVSLGAPDPHIEREPNDVAEFAELLDPGVPRSGLFAEPDDVDYFRFSLPAEQLVRIRIEPPPDMKLYFAFREERKPLVNRTAETPGDVIEYAALLLPGDYMVVLQSKQGTGTTPYVVSLDIGNRFEPIIDLEPNDAPHQARPLPADGVVRGRSKDFGDDDWYRLPQVVAPTSLTVRSEFGRQRVFLHSWDGNKKGKATLDWSQDAGAHIGVLQPGEQYVLQVGVRGDYAFDVDFDPPPADADWAMSGEVLPGISVQLEESLPEIAAFWHQSQSVQVPVRIRNDQSDTVRVVLDAATSHPAWRLSETGNTLEVGPGQTLNVPAALGIAPDFPADTPVRIDFNVRDEHGASRSASMSAVAACGATPVGPGSIWTLPDVLAGGMNVALTSLGGRIVDAPGDSSGAAQAKLYDGLTPNDVGWYRARPEFPVDLTVELAGAQPVRVAGIILNPQGRTPAGAQLRDFELHLSSDGSEYRKVLAATLSRARIPQHFVLPQTTEARFARLRILSAFDPGQSKIGLGEFAVVADPASNPFPGRRFNLADPAHGGYVAWSQPAFDLYLEAEETLTEEVERPSVRVDPVLPTEWVVGFHHGRAAQIAELQWVDSPGEPKTPRFSSVQVSTSVTGAAGPWEPLGTWTLDRAAGAPPPLVPDKPVWARYVRFVSTEAESVRRMEFADTLRILEREVDDEYRSILAEWGQYSGAAVYEWTRDASTAGAQPIGHAGNNVSKDSALPVVTGARYSDQVQRGTRITWYRIEVPAEHNRLSLSFFGKPVVNLSATLEVEGGASVPLDEVSAEGNQLLLEAVLDGGKTYWLRLEEPMRYVVMSWDNSGSVRPYRTVIYGAISNFVRDIQPGNEFVQLLPFRTGGFLLQDWSDQTQALMTGLQGYPRRDDDSNAETYLLASSNALGIERGSKAVVLVTDAATFSYDETPALWQSLGSYRPRVFTVELHIGDKAAHQQDLMQSWANVNNGHYAYFSQQSDLDVAFDRAFCHLRRPVRFDMLADTRFEEPPGPGWLTVDAESAISANAVELILDASGSMLQRLDGTRRIEIARTVLTDLVNETIPEGTSLALRIFGHRKPDACDTDLALPLQPLDRDKVTGIIQSTQAMNLARTPIGDSLARVADDLRGVDGQKLVVLITDGEETCDGDPAAEITALKEAGHDVRINIVGFAIDDAALKAEFESWARMGGGLYFNASSAEELEEALKEAMRPKFQVLGDAGDIIANGTTGGASLNLPSGSYTVKILTSPIQTFTEVNIKPEETTRISAETN